MLKWRLCDGDILKYVVLAVKWSACHVHGRNMDEGQLSTLRSRFLNDSRVLLLRDRFRLSDY